MRTRLWMLAVLLACAAPRPQPPRGVEVLRVEGEVENAPFRFGRDDLPALPRRAFEAVPPGAQARRRFEGVSLDLLLKDRMEVKSEADVAVIHGEGGLAVPVPLALIRQLGPVLADHVDGSPTGSPGAAPVALALAWPNADHPGIDTDPRLRWWWVASVRSISVQSWMDTLGRALQVPAGAGDDARHGAAVLGSQCIGCHAVRGAGGTRGPSLTLGAAPAVRLRTQPHAFRDHLRAVGDAGAPALGAERVAQVAAFLEAVIRAGPQPDDAVRPLAPLDEEAPAPPTPRPPGPPPVTGR